MTKYLGLPINASDSGAGVDNLILYVHVLMALLFVGWLAYFLYVLFRFRASRNPRPDYAGVKHHGSSYIEGMVVVAEAFLLLGLAIPLWRAVAEEFPAEEESTVMHVVARQFDFTARYPGMDRIFGAANPDLVTTANPLGLDPGDPQGFDDFLAVGSELDPIVVPVGRPVIMHISSLDVIHSVAIKPMRVTQDAIPGLIIPAWFTPSRIGTYQITCAQLCGSSHYAMKGHLQVVSEEDYWVWKAMKVGEAMAKAGVLPDYE